MEEQRRYAISVQVIGVVRRDSPKVKMFIVSVLWSDESEVLIYRTFKDFKDFHRRLKKRFPHDNVFRQRDRAIPKFKARAIKSSMQQKGSGRSVRRMHFLDSYCAELLSCEPNVTQSIEVTQFLTSKGYDLQPDFTKNSVMILYADEKSDGLEGGTGDRSHKYLSVSNVSQPFITKTYRSVAAHETKDTKNRPFKAVPDEKLDVLIKDPTGWWLVENEKKQLAWFPAPFLELCEEDCDYDRDGFIPGGALHCAVKSYTSKNPDEVSVPIGAVVEVLRATDDGWWLVRYNGKSGYLPSMYLQPYTNPRAGLHSLQRRLHSSTLQLATPTPTHNTYGKRCPSTVHEENDPLQVDLELSKHEQISGPGLLRHAHSIDILSETHLPSVYPGQSKSNTPISRDIVSSLSTVSDLSSFSSGSSSLSDSYSSTLSSQPSSGDGELPKPEVGFSCRSSSQGSGSNGFEEIRRTPRVPARPKPQEILTRCTTMTRKTALTSQAFLLARQQQIEIC